MCTLQQVKHVHWKCHLVLRILLGVPGSIITGAVTYVTVGWGRTSGMDQEELFYRFTLQPLCSHVDGWFKIICGLCSMKSPMNTTHTWMIRSLYSSLYIYWNDGNSNINCHCYCLPRPVYFIGGIVLHLSFSLFVLSSSSFF